MVCNVPRMSEHEKLKKDFKRIEKKLDKILALLEPGIAITSLNEDDWKTAQWTIDYLGFSIRTLYRNRADGHIRWIKEGSEPLYYRPDAEKLKYKYMR